MIRIAGWVSDTGFTKPTIHGQKSCNGIATRFLKHMGRRTTRFLKWRLSWSALHSMTNFSLSANFIPMLIFILGSFSKPSVFRYLCLRRNLQWHVLLVGFLIGMKLLQARRSRSCGRVNSMWDRICVLLCLLPNERSTNPLLGELCNLLQTGGKCLKSGFRFKSVFHHHYNLQRNSLCISINPVRPQAWRGLTHAITHNSPP